MPTLPMKMGVTLIERPVGADTYKNLRSSACKVRVEAGLASDLPRGEDATKYVPGCSTTTVYVAGSSTATRVSPKKTGKVAESCGARSRYTTAFPGGGS
jgi:hypothetical protein